MNAFWSGTDDANENMNQFYLVWGKVMDAKPEYRLRYCFDKVKEDIDSVPFELFEWPTQKYEESVRTVKAVTTTKKMIIDGDLTGIAPSDFLSNFEDNCATLVTTEDSDDTVNNNEISVIYRGPFEELDFQEDWMTQHTPSRAIPAYNYGGVTGGHGTYPTGSTYSGYRGYGAASITKPQIGGAASTGAYSANRRKEFEAVEYCVKTGTFEKKH